jgi:S-DNA-T family DNA segregation ATPase FtsK/SpoIIIE
MERELDRLGLVLLDKLRTFNVQSELGGRTSGPMVTQFEVVPAPGVKVNRIANLDADLALAMKAQSIRIVAPIPGKGAVGVEIPNPEPEMVHLREILEAREYQNARGHLPLALGKDLTGRPYVADLGKMPHVLIAGATGSGKSVCINTVVTSLVCRHTPETLRLLMIDPKMVELSAYADLPHLRHPVITDPRDAAGVLKWAVLEMERRYQLLSANGVRSLGEFNKRAREGVTLRRFDAPGPEGDPDRWIHEEGQLPYIVVVVDELADLMMTVQSEIEKPLAQLAQKARAIGIHLIVATQRPSVNVITGLIKANFPTRIGFRVASKTDSRTILDQNGAEALLGNGDMLFLPPGASEPVRIQGAYISTEDTDALLGWYREQAALRVDESDEAPLPDEPDILEELRSREADEAAFQPEEIRGDWDDLFRPAAEICVQHDQGSTSLLQRRLKIGYGRAARIVDQLHDAGVLGPPDGSRPREVLVSLSELDDICGPSPS